MAQIKIKRGRDLKEEFFEKFSKDLTLFLQVFPPILLSRWWGRHKSNLSKKLNGHEPITWKDFNSFYRQLGPVLNKMEQGIPPKKIELDMLVFDKKPPEKIELDMLVFDKKPSEYQQLWEEIQRIKETLQRQGEQLDELKRSQHQT